MQQTGEIILYQPNENVQLEVRLEEETVWLNRHQMALLFDRDIKTIGKHINNALVEELLGLPVVAKFATTAKDGKTYLVEHYNLDMILSVGYRVSKQPFIRNKSCLHCKTTSTSTTHSMNLLMFKSLPTPTTVS